MFFGSLHQKLRVGGPPTGSVHRDGSFFLCIVTGAVDCVRVRWSCTPRRVRRCGVISYALSRQSYFTSLSLRRLRLRVAAQASRASLFRCFCNSRRWGVMYHVLLRQACVPFSERRCGVTVCLQSRRRQPVLLCFPPSGVTFLLRASGGATVDVDSIKGCAVHPEIVFHCSEASQSTTKVSKHSAATAGQLPLGTEESFLLTREEYQHSVELHRYVPSIGSSLQLRS